MYNKTSREILLIKEKYGISDNDPVFALLDVYGSLLQDLNGALRTVKEAQSIAHSSLQDIKQEELTLTEFLKVHKVEIAEQGVKVGKILNEDMSFQLQGLFKSIDQYRSGIENERKLLNNDRISHDNNLKTLFTQYNKDKLAQKASNNVSYAILALMILMQSVSIVTLLNFIG